MRRLQPLPSVDELRPFGRALATGDRRQLVVDAAARLFERRGYQGTSMQDIAEEVGITKAALYHYVSSKDELIYEIHDAFVSTMIDEVEQFFPSHPDPVEQLRFVISSIFRAIADYRPYVRVFFQERHNLEHAEWYAKVEEKRDFYERVVRDCLDRGVDQGVFELPMGSLLASRYVFGACNWGYQWLDAKGPTPHEELAEYWSVLILKSFAVSSPPAA